MLLCEGGVRREAGEWERSVLWLLVCLFGVGGELVLGTGRDGMGGQGGDFVWRVRPDRVACSWSE